MKNKLFTLALMTGWLLAPALAHAAKTTYVFTDRRFQFVKKVEVGKETLKERQMNHPYTFTEWQLRELLSGIQFNKQLVLKKDIESAEVFNEDSLNFVVPHLVKAFEEAKQNEEVFFSFVTHKPKFLIRDDKLTIVKAWVEGNQLHLEFRKLMAKISNDYDKLGDVTQAMNRARGLRVSLELGAGQQYGKSTDEILLTIPEVGLAQEKTRDQRLETSDQKQKKMEKVEASVPSSAEERLKQLDHLKKKGLISKEEYQQKRQEILGQL